MRGLGQYVQLDFQFSRTGRGPLRLAQTSGHFDRQFAEKGKTRHCREVSALAKAKGSNSRRALRKSRPTPYSS